MDTDRHPDPNAPSSRRFSHRSLLRTAGVGLTDQCDGHGCIRSVLVLDRIDDNINRN
jgi:hypothetical protein